MSDKRDDIQDEPLSPEAEAARRRLHEMPAAEARPAFRARLREDFATGRLTEPATEPAAKRRRSSPWRWAWIALPAAAALVLLMNRFGTQETRWILWEVRGDSGHVEWNGRGFALADSNALRRAIERGGDIDISGNMELDFFQKGFAAFQFVPGTRCSITAPPKRLGDRAVAIRLDDGEVRISTGVRFRGAVITIETAETRVELTGTTLAVIKDQTGTCVCAFVGEITMHDADGTTAVVPVGRRRVTYNDGRPPEITDLAPGESMKLGMFLDLQRDNLHE